MIRYQPKVGEILECNFGQFRDNDNGGRNYYDFDGRIFPEMIKKRLVVVINPKLGGELILVVPLSTTKKQYSIDRGIHIAVDPCYTKITPKYQSTPRWAKCEAIQLVSKHRLFKGDYNGLGKLPREVVTLIQRGIIKAINANALLSDFQPLTD